MCDDIESVRGVEEGKMVGPGGIATILICDFLSITVLLQHLLETQRPKD